jgi:transcription elongation factor Elf1
MTEPSRLSLRTLGLIAPDGLACPQGGSHQVLEPELQIAAAAGGGIVRCQQCGQEIELRPLTEL